MIGPRVQEPDKGDGWRVRVDSGLVGFDFGNYVPWRRVLLGRGDEGDRRSKKGVSGILWGCLQQGVYRICMQGRC